MQGNLMQYLMLLVRLSDNTNIFIKKNMQHYKIAENRILFKFYFMKCRYCHKFGLFHSVLDEKPRNFIY